MPIIINGGSRCAGGWWGRHLENAEKNERVELVEITGLSAETVPDAFREMQAVSLGTKCQNYFYQANINPRADEHLTPAQWREAIDTLEQNLGLAGQPRFVVEHEKEGRTHRHIVWSRIDAERMTAIPDSLTAAIHERTSRELEIKFDLERGVSVLVADREQQRPERRPQKWEMFRGEGSGLDPREIGRELAALRQRSDNGQSFKAALEASGYVLARGDRRDFVVIDRAGDEHSLARRAGMKAAELRAFMKDVDRAGLPSVAQGKTQQQARLMEAEQRKAAIGRYDDIRPEIAAEAGQAQKHGRGADDAAGHANARTSGDQRGAEMPRNKGEAEKNYSKRALGKTAGEIRLAWTLSRSPGQLGEALEARGITLATVTAAEARANQRRRAFAKELGRYVRPLREGEIVAVDARGYVHSLDKRTTGDGRAEIEQRLAGVDRDGLLSVSDAKDAMREASRAAWAEQQRSKRESERPATGIEIKIAGALKATMTGHDFAEAVEKAGLTITRATAGDVQALEALRHDDQLAAASGLEASGRHFAQLEQGDFAAVTKSGDVFRLNPHKLDFVEIEQRLADTQPRLPSIVEARAHNEIMREATAAFWAEVRAENTAGRAASTETQADRQTHSAAATDQQARQETIATMDETIDAGARSLDRIVGGVASMIGKALDVLADMIAPAPPPTREQVRQMEQAAEDTQAQTAARRETDQRLAQTIDMGRAARAEAEREEQERARERERQREQERGRDRY